MKLCTGKRNMSIIPFLRRSAKGSDLPLFDGTHLFITTGSCRFFSWSCLQMVVINFSVSQKLPRVCLLQPLPRVSVLNLGEDRGTDERRSGSRSLQGPQPQQQKHHSQTHM